jgi:membrane-bound ClpP family serine protease
MEQGKYFAARLALAIISMALEIVAIYAIWRWVLPELGINMHVYFLITILVLLGIFSVSMFIFGTRALSRKGLVGLSTMIGTIGKVARIISHKESGGMVLIKGELWTAESDEGKISLGEKIEVVGEDGLKLVVRKKQAKE